MRNYHQKIATEKLLWIKNYNGPVSRTSFQLIEMSHFSGNLSEKYELDVGKSRDQNPDNIFKESK